ncbi:acetoin utilization protein AcuC [Paenibacillus psychroresistens]|uniref:Acetoin utilization protein AcuC n=1 Tax=Paenibacillus psychroresistens TaxID=1778678 RepID=A0A6B8RYP0_9BACL|nr:acetoin utilization protein AcuC [Paenibacillus psychroresistens]QGR00167.1 acetoin utilization protein AcuC [Paenibacillus psychroresistens]
MKYHFYEGHPFNQHRLKLTEDLLRRVGAIPAEILRLPDQASDEELALVHSLPYIQAVRALSQTAINEDWLKKACSFGLDLEGDTPYFEGMHQASAQIVGGTLAAVEAVMSGETKHALHLGGGLHHAMPGKGSGFCVYNDAAVAIAAIQKKYKARVMYVDTDVHHGDGVQWMFYTDPDVLTLSIHETGKYLFPGTGAVNERGEENGFGFSLNLPMEPYTEDESWLECFTEVFNQAVASFKPDIIISQHGCDAHASDPLAHIQCSMQSYWHMPEIIHEAAHKWCEGRWVALGGGGYDIWRVVPRAWSLLWLVMNEHPIVHALESNQQLELPLDWLERWQQQSPEELPKTWLDDTEQWDAMPRRIEITEKNRKTKELSMLYLQK